MKKLQRKMDITLLGMALVGVAALACAGAFSVGTLSLGIMLLACIVCALAEYQLLCIYQRLQALARHRAVRRVAAKATTALYVVNGHADDGCVA